MRRALWPCPAIALFIVCLALGLSARPGPPAPPPYPTRLVPTVEPLPPVSIEMQFSGRSEWGGGGSAVIDTDIVAGGEIEEITLNLDLPAGLTLNGAERLTARQGSLRAGERLVRHLPVVAARNGDFSVRLEAEVRLSDGRTFRVGQGATLRIGRPQPEGRLHNGAYEVRGAPMSELRR